MGGWVEATGDAAHRTAAVTALDAALKAWKTYASVASRRYLPQMLTRVGYVDLEQITEQVANDLEWALSRP